MSSFGGHIPVNLHEEYVTFSLTSPFTYLNEKLEFRVSEFIPTDGYLHNSFDLSHFLSKAFIDRLGNRIGLLQQTHLRQAISDHEYSFFAFKRGTMVGVHHPTMFMKYIRKMLESGLSPHIFVDFHDSVYDVTRQQLQLYSIPKNLREEEVTFSLRSPFPSLNEELDFRVSDFTHADGILLSVFELDQFFSQDFTESLGNHVGAPQRTQLRNAFLKQDFRLYAMKRGKLVNVSYAPSFMKYIRVMLETGLSPHIFIELPDATYEPTRQKHLLESAVKVPSDGAHHFVSSNSNHAPSPPDSTSHVQVPNTSGMLHVKPKGFTVSRKPALSGPVHISPPASVQVTNTNGMLQVKPKGSKVSRKPASSGPVHFSPPHSVQVASTGGMFHVKPKGSTVSRVYRDHELIGIDTEVALTRCLPVLTNKSSIPEATSSEVIHDTLLEQITSLPSKVLTMMPADKFTKDTVINTTPRPKVRCAVCGGLHPTHLCFFLGSRNKIPKCVIADSPLQEKLECHPCPHDPVLGDPVTKSVFGHGLQESHSFACGVSFFPSKDSVIKSVNLLFILFRMIYNSISLLHRSALPIVLDPVDKPLLILGRSEFDCCKFGQFRMNNTLKEDTECGSWTFYEGRSQAITYGLNDGNHLFFDPGDIPHPFRLTVSCA